LLTAFAALAAVIWFVKVMRDQHDGALSLAAGILACAIGLQLLLGVEVWMVQLASGTLPDLLPLTAQRVSVRTAHVLGGSLLLTATVTAFLLAHRSSAETNAGPEAAA
jgi:hypothetical protein